MLYTVSIGSCLNWICLTWVTHNPSLKVRQTSVFTPVQLKNDELSQLREMTFSSC